MTIRPANAADAEQVAAIYNHGIAERQATFETRPRAARPRSRAGSRRAARSSSPPRTTTRHPRLRPRLGVLDPRGLRGRRRAHASTCPRTRAAATSASTLLNALADAAEQAGYHKLTSRVFTTNDASLALHRKAGLHRGRHPAPPRASSTASGRTRSWSSACSATRRATNYDSRPDAFRSTAGRLQPRPDAHDRRSSPAGGWRPDALRINPAGATLEVDGVFHTPLQAHARPAAPRHDRPRPGARSRARRAASRSSSASARPPSCRASRASRAGCGRAPAARR